MLLNLQRRRLQHLVGRGAPSRSSCCTLATLAGKLAENYINPACFRFQDERNRKHSYLKPEYVMRQVWCLSVTPTSSCQYVRPIQHYCTRCQGLWLCMGTSGEDIDHHSLAGRTKLDCIEWKSSCESIAQRCDYIVFPKLAQKPTKAQEGYLELSTVSIKDLVWPS